MARWLAMNSLRKFIETIRTANAFARIFGTGRVKYGPNFIQPPEPTPDDPYAVDWQWTYVRRILAGGPNDGEDAGICRRCYLSDSIMTTDVRYRIGIYRDAHTVEYVPA